MKDERMYRSSRMLVVACCMLLFFGCVTTVIVGSPYDRYDHNRTRIISILPVLPPQEMPQEEVYRPTGSELFSQAKYEGVGQTDALPAANVVPIFTGVPLPLSKAAVDNGQSDWNDLVDYLAAGPLAQAGIAKGDMESDVKRAEEQYKEILDFLGNDAKLRGNRAEVIARLYELHLNVADEVIDGRYRLRAFADVLSVKSGDFWFVLYQLPKTLRYSRLVVVPVRSAGQDFRAKTMQ